MFNIYTNKKHLSFSTSISKSFFTILFLGILFGNISVAVYGELTTSSHFLLLELIDTETDKEEKKHEVEKEKVNLSNTSFSHFSSNLQALTRSDIDFKTCHQGDIPTPPPEFI